MTVYLMPPATSAGVCTVPGLHRDAAEQLLEVEVLAGGQDEGLGAVVGVQQDHGQPQPPLVVRDVRREVPVPGDENDARPAPAVEVREPGDDK